MKRKIVIGLEIHLQLKTKTKLFCGCSTDYIGATPNTNVCPICLAVPGTLPVINDHAVDLAVKMGLGLHCEIQDGTRFHRKHYFYADLPKAYQITQYEHAIAQGGYLDVIADGKPKRIRLDHLHLEEDAGKLVHPTADGRLSGAAYSLVDYNRGGMPLSEIVSMPDMNSPAEAIAYVTQIRQLARYLDVSDGEMESGSLRVDVNVSLCNPDGSFGTRVELKNINSLKSIERALEYEIARQNRVLDEGGTLVQETRLWDDAAGVTRSMRSKEGARDYRYYVEMDLAPIDAKPDYVERIRASLPELPGARRKRLHAEWGYADAEMRDVVNAGALHLIEATVAAGATPAAARKWWMGELARHAKQAEIGLDEVAITPAQIAQLQSLVDAGRINDKLARQVLEGVLAGEGDPEAVVVARGLEVVSDDGALLEAVDAALAAQPDIVEKVRGGNMGPVGAIIGAVMKATKGQADAKRVRELVLDRIGG